MKLESLVDPTVLDTVLGRLAVLFLAAAGGDIAKARLAASGMLAEYQPQSAEELGLAADIVSFRMHSIEALAQAAAPDMPLRTVIRLRGSAVSLSRAAHRSQAKLDQLRRPRTTPEQPARQDAAAAGQDEREKAAQRAIEVIEAAREAVAAATKGEVKTWTKAYQDRQRANRIAENARRNAAAFAAAQAGAQPPAAMAQAG